MNRISPTVVKIDLDALRHNYRQLRKRVPGGVKSLCVVKSNAYGHGAGPVARALQEEGADLFGVGTVDEGIELRRAGIKRPILILLGLLEDLPPVLRHRLTPVIYDLQTARRLDSFLSRKKRRIPVHLKVDTGMSRLGILPQEVGPFCDQLKKLSFLEPIGLLTHLADAGEEKFTQRQFRIFERARREFQQRFPGAGFFHLANSQAVIENPSPFARGHWMVRLGIALYGAHPLERDRKLVSLKPVLCWKTRIALVKRLPPKTPVSYGRTFYTKRESVIGVLPVGYADGYPRILSNRSQVLVRGKKVPVIGMICMDMMMIDLTSLPGVKAGEEAVLIGRQGRGEIRAEDLAKRAGTISYEIFCMISPRIRRVSS